MEWIDGGWGGRTLKSLLLVNMHSFKQVSRKST